MAVLHYPLWNLILLEKCLNTPASKFLEQGILSIIIIAFFNTRLSLAVCIQPTLHKCKFLAINSWSLHLMWYSYTFLEWNFASNMSFALMQMQPTFNLWCFNCRSSRKASSWWGRQRWRWVGSPEQVSIRTCFIWNNKTYQVRDAFCSKSPKIDDFMRNQPGRSFFSEESTVASGKYPTRWKFLKRRGSRSRISISSSVKSETTNGTEIGAGFGARMLVGVCLEVEASWFSFNKDVRFLVVWTCSVLPVLMTCASCFM